MLCEKRRLMRTLLLYVFSVSSSNAFSLQATPASKQFTSRTGTFALFAKTPGAQNSRRGFIRSLFGVIIVSGLPNNASAFDRTAYPVELYASDASSRDPLLDKKDAIVNRNRSQSDGPGGLLLRGSLWASALWFLSGSRSNPLVTPLANILFNDDDEEWLKDRNDGLFSGIPSSLLVVLVVLFGAFGFGADQIMTVLADNDTDVSLQLAGVSLIGGCSLELGRIASGEKKQTRAESDRSSTLEAEFAEFAEKRLIPGGNCHRNEVVRAFRRYFAKYRQADSEKYPLTDLEIEQMLRGYGRRNGLEMSSAGFYNGIQINSDADVFVKR